MKRIVPAVLIAGTLAFAACGSSSSTTSPTTAPAASGGGTTATTTGGSTGGGGKGTTLTESGSSLLYPFLQSVATQFHKANPTITVNTAAGGSGKGISDAAAGNTSFGGSDAYLSPSDMSQYPGLANIPVVVSSQAVNYNLPGIKNLKFTGSVLASIYEGKITSWNDPAITKLNPGVKLPSEKISPIHRADSSGDTFLFTSFLSSTTPAWAKSVGENTTVTWPSVSGSASATGNPGMVQAAQGKKGSIAYIGISAEADAKKAGLGEAELQNKAGKYLQSDPTTVNSAVAASVAKVPSSLAASLIYAAGANSYPIVNFEYIIVKTSQSSSATAKAIQTFLTYVIDPSKGSSPTNLRADNFEALPSSIAAKSKTAVAAIK